MKKLNKKGFTLVELLAVIVILAIVVGISIPAITSVINNSKNSALGVSVDAAAKYLKEQYDVYSVDSTLAETKIVSTWFKSDKVGKVGSVTDAATLKLMGLDTTKVKKLEACVTETGSVYVAITEVPTTSDYYTTAYWDSTGKPKTTTITNRDGTTTTKVIDGLKNTSGDATLSADKTTCS